MGKSAAALAYYLLFSFFPLLIFLSALVGFLDLGPISLEGSLARIIPAQVLELVNVYLQHVTELRSANLLAASLVVTLWLPMRAVDLDEGGEPGLRYPKPPAHLPAPAGGGPVHPFPHGGDPSGRRPVCTAGRNFLTFLSRYLPSITPFIDLWNVLRFPMMGRVFFWCWGPSLGGPGVTGPRRRVFPGSVAALASWLLFSLGFSFYVRMWPIIPSFTGPWGALW